MICWDRLSILSQRISGEQAAPWQKYQLMKELRTHGPVVPVKFIGERAWLICGYPELKSAMADEEHFMMAAAYREHALPVMGHTMETMTGEWSVGQSNSG